MWNHKYFIYLCTSIFIVTGINGYRTIKSKKDVIIFAKSMETVDIVCENDLPLARCGFTHPNGTKILFQNLVPGTPLCKYTTEATSLDVGVWTCHFWSEISPQQEMTKHIDVRLAHKFAALHRDLKVLEGEEVSLSCVSTERMVPLTYCYFMTPGSERIHMDDEITRENALMQRYFFPRNKSIHRGDCGVTITSASPSDAGTWSCYGWLETENRQFTDTIRLIVEGDEIAIAEETEASDLVSDDAPITITPTTYVCSTLAFLGFFTAMLIWKYRYYTRYYGKTWGDDESINSYVVKHKVDETPIVATGDYLLIT